MIADIFKTILKNIQFFLVAWVIVIIINQIVIFGGCFAGYCILAALPHTSIIAGLFTFFYLKDSSDNSIKGKSRTVNPSIPETQKNNDIRCPNCGSTMNIRLAKRGRFAGKQFLSCSKYPQCNGIVNID